MKAPTPGIASAPMPASHPKAPPMMAPELPPATAGFRRFRMLLVGEVFRALIIGK